MSQVTTFQHRIDDVQCKIIRNGVDAVYVEYKAAGVAAGIPESKLRNFYNHCKSCCNTFVTPSKSRYYSVDDIVNSAVSKPAFFERNGMDAGYFSTLKKRAMAAESEWEADVELAGVSIENADESDQLTPTYSSNTGVNLSEVKELREDLHAMEVRVSQVTRERDEVKNKLHAITALNDELSMKLKAATERLRKTGQQLESRGSAVSSLQGRLDAAIKSDAEAQNAISKLSAEIKALQAKSSVEIQKADAQIEALQAKLADLTADKLQIEEENLDLQLGTKTGANPIETLVTSRRFNMTFIGFVMGATFLAAFTKFMASLTANAALLDTMSGITFFIISLALAFGVVWFSYNKSEKAWINATVLVVLFLCEWVSFSKFTGLETGWDALDNGRDWIFSIFLPVLTLLLAKMQSNKAMRIDITDAIHLMRSAMRKNGVANISQIVIDLKKEMLTKNHK